MTCPYTDILNISVTAIYMPQMDTLFLSIWFHAVTVQLHNGSKYHFFQFKNKPWFPLEMHVTGFMHVKWRNLSAISTQGIPMPITYAISITISQTVIT